MRKKRQKKIKYKYNNIKRCINNNNIDNKSNKLLTRRWQSFVVHNFNHSFTDIRCLIINSKHEVASYRESE